MAFSSRSEVITSAAPENSSRCFHKKWNTSLTRASKATILSRSARHNSRPALWRIAVSYVSTDRFMDAEALRKSCMNACCVATTSSWSRVQDCLMF
jgi:hypothetical protein